MDVVSGDAGKRLSVRDVHRRTGRRHLIGNAQDVLPLEPRIQHQQGTRHKACSERASHDAGTFGEEEPLSRLASPAQLDVGESCVVAAAVHRRADPPR